MRSESAAHRGPNRFCVPVLLFLFRHTSRLGGTWPGTQFYLMVCNIENETVRLTLCGRSLASSATVVLGRIPQEKD